MTELVRAHQENCFEAIWTSLGGRFPSALVKEAFFKVPRHLFVERYCSQGNPKMREVTPETLDEHLPAIYANGGLGIHYEPEDLGDGSLGPTAGEFDRAVFTAGAADLPARFFTQVRDGGKLIFVLAIPGGGNVLVLFQRRGAVFESLATRRCAFVPVTGEGAAAVAANQSPGAVGEWLERTPFPLSSPDRGVDLRSYLWMVEPGFEIFIESNGRQSFGIRRGNSLALVRDGHLEIHGSRAAGHALREHLRAWSCAGRRRPSPSKLDEGAAIPSRRGAHRASRAL